MILFNGKISDIRDVNWGCQQQHDGSTDIIDVRNRVMRLLIRMVYSCFPLSRFFLKGTMELKPA